ncbi:MAG: hypothetical protein AAF488_09170 [Planctomycetota bacterium]
MILQIFLFVLICSVVGAVNLLISGPLERSFLREFLSFAWVVMGGIAAFTGAIVILSMLFQ